MLQAINSKIRDLQIRITLYSEVRAYEELYKLLFIELNRYSYSFTKSNECAEEVVSDVFIKLWKVRMQLREINNLRKYLYTATKNYSLNYILKTSKKQVVELDEIIIDTRASVTNNSPEDIYITNELMNNIKRVIQELPPQCQQIFQLVREDGLKYKEVASILNISPCTVRNQMVIAIRKISCALMLTNDLSFSKS
ncbi:RNA polymerase sigma-70 factor [Arachidicoccus soli]|uniref:RNA polymerase sigma-70 factor n=1 Tax=Arachidicoccus soli TaxID=2341117 RepID=A0A386HQ02_9BACT|nr:RNA polymerase sigma-70 factor [Arachidicoccus soli]AYD48027.1 RNA polymerase sigma-70 factor [Arachidicoccus soli]